MAFLQPPLPLHWVPFFHKASSLPAAVSLAGGGESGMGYVGADTRAKGLALKTHVQKEHVEEEVV